MSGMRCKKCGWHCRDSDCIYLAERAPSGELTDAQRENAEFTEWWSRAQACPEHSLITENAAHAAWQERARRTTAGTTAPEKPFAGPGAWFSVDVLGKPMRQYAPGKWENCVWPSERATAGNAAPTEAAGIPKRAWSKEADMMESWAATTAPGDLSDARINEIADTTPQTGAWLTDFARAIAREVLASNASAVPGCACRACTPHMVGRMMFICATCGDKRCPHAADHRDACSAAPSTSPAGAERKAP
jgi:hypothetical protein